MRPAHDILAQIRWDPAFDAADFFVSYDDHAGADVEVPLAEFDPTDEIPRHRIRSIRKGPETVWDRRRGIDRIAEIRRASGRRT